MIEKVIEREESQTSASWHSSKVKNSRQGRPIVLARGCTTILSLSLLLSSLSSLSLLPSFSWVFCYCCDVRALQSIWCLEALWIYLLSLIGSNYLTVFHPSTSQEFLILFIYYPYRPIYPSQPRLIQSCIPLFWVGLTRQYLNKPTYTIATYHRFHLVGLMVWLGFISKA